MTVDVPRANNVIVVVPGPAVVNLTCLGFYLAAGDFLVAARASAPLMRPRSFVGHFLCCQSIELSLKAFLSLKGYERDRMKRLGHKLKALFDAAVPFGLAHVVSLEANDRLLLGEASDWYDSSGGKRFQYFAVRDAVLGYPGAPAVAALEALAGRLQSPALHAAVQAA